MAAANMSPPSLKKLCEEMAINQILRSDKPDSDFAALNPRTKVLLFTKLRAGYAHLSKKHRKWRCLACFCPQTDLDMYLTSTRIRKRDERNSHNQQRSFRDRWSYFIVPSFYVDDRPRREEASDWKPVYDVNWSSRHLVSESPKTDVKLCFHSWVLEPCPCRPKGWEPFSARISPQLLLYRLIVIFGMPPPTEGDPDKVC